MIRISQIKLGLDEDESLLKDKIRKKLLLNKRIEFTYHIHKRNIDARKSDQIYFVYSIDVQLPNEKEILKRHDKDVTPTPPAYGYKLEKGIHYLKHRPIVVGFGPAGIFASYLLAKEGYCPIILERGEDVDQRSHSVEKFFSQGILNEESNIQFGEGGAGTFSDGKLTARSKDPRVSYLYKTLVSFGAPKEIMYESNPHIGSDLLKGIIKRMRKEIIALGGEIHFNEQVEALHIENNTIMAVVSKKQVWNTNQIVLAIGNSARDTMEMLHRHGVSLAAKNFAVGVRIEHHQEMINRSLYHQFVGHESLPAASYRLTCKQEAHTKGAYTFCMCPGGSVVAASSLKEHVVVNGMSLHARDLENANSAILVPMEAQDFPSDDVFAGMKFLDELEKKAYTLGGRNYRAPAQRVKDFLNYQPSTHIGNITPTYPLGVTLCNLHELLPKNVCDSIVHALAIFNQKLDGFMNDDALLTAVETRSSSPLRINRDPQTLQSINVAGLYPCGEGAGYAGGIISSAIDGLKCAEQIIKEYRYER